MRSTPVQIVLNRMDRYSSIMVVPEAFKIRDLDEAIRGIRRGRALPWNTQKGTLRVFDGVSMYPVATDHDELAYIDDARQQLYPQTARFRYTSLQQFFEDPDNRNQLAEIFDGNTRFLGVNYKRIGLGSQVLNNGERAADWTASGVASTPTLDQVNYKEGNGSIRFTVTGPGTATMKGLLSSNVADGEYKRKYHFFWIYLDAVPTSLTLRLHVDASNYLQQTGITTQFSGQALKADDWNLVAMDLNTATATGTIATVPTFTYEEFDLVGATAGTYYVDSSYLRAWRLMDYWYYSIYAIKTLNSTIADQEYIYNSADVYATDSEIVGDSEWIDIIMYEAMFSEMVDQKDSDQRKEIGDKRDKAWAAFDAKYPSLEPVIITNVTRYTDDFLLPE